MKKLIISWAVNVLSLWVVDAMMKSIYFVDFKAIALTGLILAVLNVTLKPVLKFISFPISVLTLGLFSLVINGLILYIAIHFSAGSYVSSFGMAVVASLLLSIVNGALEALLD